MRLIRLAVLEMDPAPNGWDSWEVAIGEVELATLRVLEGQSEDENKLRLVTAAAVVLAKRIINPATASMMIMIMEGI